MSSCRAAAGLALLALAPAGCKDAFVEQPAHAPATPFNAAKAFNNDVTVVAPAGDGSGDVYVGGDFTTYQGAAANRLVRLNADGNADAGFNTGHGFNDSVFSIAPAGGGSAKLYVGGAFTSCRTTTTDRVARLNPDGTPE